VARVVEVDRAVGFRQPQRDSVPAQDRGELVELPTLEGAFVRADHDRVEAATDGADVGQQPGGVRSIGPGDPARDAGVDVLGHDAPAPGDQLLRRRGLPVERRSVVLMVGGGDPAVERQADTISLGSDALWTELPVPTS
jgi:hypothetical protein